MTESNSPETRRAWVNIDLAALRANAREVAQRASAPLLPMVKANGYGLGAVRVARALESLDPFGFGVATVEEAQALRAAGIGRPLLVLSPLMPWAVHAMLAVEARPAIGDVAALEAWLAQGKAPFHLEIDTGMGRAGFRLDDHDALARARTLLAGATGWEGVFTHFHSADSSPESALPQWEQLQQAIAALGRRPRLVHAAASSGAFADPRFGGDLARPGIYMYGGSVGVAAPRAVARFQARIIALRRVSPGDSVSYGATWSAPRATMLATVGAGYEDGVIRSLSNRGRVEVGGAVYPIVGRVTMDMTVIDVGDAPVSIGDHATIWGGAVTLDAQAAHAGTNSYEMLTSLGSRVVRRYHE